MDNTNIYGFYSGGFLFDMADRVGQAIAITELDYPYIMTMWGKVKYLKQACEVPNRISVRPIRNIFSRDTVKVLVKLWDKDTLLCEVLLRFKGKNKNYCENIKKNIKKLLTM